MKKYIIEYDLYDDVQALLGHDVPHTNLTNVKTVVVDLTDEEFNALVGAGVSIREDVFIKFEDALLFMPTPVPNSQNPPTELLNYYNVTNAHAAGFTGVGVKVGVIDTGQHDNHHAAAPNVIRHDFSIDQTGVSVEAQPHGGRGCIIIGQTNQFTGTAVAGAAALFGIAYDCELHSFRVMENWGGIYSSSVISSIEYCIANDFDIINISLSMGAGLETCINAALAQGMIVVCASGNSPYTYMAHPANIEGVVAVSAWSSVSQFFGSYLTGDGSAKLSGVAYCQGHTSTAGGTSQGAFTVTGILAIYKQKYPSLNSEKAMRLLIKKAIPIDGYDYSVDTGVKNKLVNYQTGGGFIAPIN